MAKQPEQTNQPEFAIQRVYLKDMSLETPNSPAIFRDEWNPQVNVDLHTNATKLDNNNHEVTLSITATAKLGEKVAFLVEVQQAGIFTLAGFDEQQMGPMLGSFCPNILFPYARETVSELVGRGGFPQLYLSPINFDALYEQHIKSQQESQTEKGQSETEH